MAYPAKLENSDEMVQIVDKRTTVRDLTILIDAEGNRYTPVNNTAEVRPVEPGEDPDGDEEGVAPPIDPEAVTGTAADEIRGSHKGLDRVEGDQADPTATAVPGDTKKGK